MSEPPMNPEPAERFSSRVELYARYRPGYPEEVIALLRDLGLSSSSVVADIGSGTGIFTRLLLGEGCRVLAIEPNRRMRECAERLLGGEPGFESVQGCGEATGLPPASVDLVTVAQAFHWLDPSKARDEFARILRPGGRAILIWNDRRTDTTPFLRAYEDLLLRYGTDYREVRPGYADEQAIAELFPGGFERRRFENSQSFDLEGLRGRLLSSSYAPLPGEPGHGEMMEELGRIFLEHQEDGRVGFEYDTEVFTKAVPEGRGRG